MNLYAWFSVFLGASALTYGWFARKAEGARGGLGRSNATWLMIGGAVPLLLGLRDLLLG